MSFDSLYTTEFKMAPTAKELQEFLVSCKLQQEVKAFFRYAIVHPKVIKDFLVIFLRGQKIPVLICYTDTVTGIFHFDWTCETWVSNTTRQLQIDVLKHFLSAHIPFLPVDFPEDSYE